MDFIDYESLLDMIYPIGMIIHTKDKISPSRLLGVGNWELVSIETEYDTEDPNYYYVEHKWCRIP